MINWNTVRNSFPITKNLIYFESAGMSPVSQAVLDAIVKEYDILARFGDVYYEKDLEKFEELKKLSAEIIGASSDDVNFVANTSFAMSIVALGLKDVYANAGIISMSDEFPSTTIPFQHQGVAIKYIPSDNYRYDVDKIIAEIDDTTKAVVTSYIQYCTGFRQNLMKLGSALKERGILFIVNATQGVPFFPVDVVSMHIDVLTASLHKWGCSGHVGSLFYTSQAFREKFKPPMAGWLSAYPAEGDFIPDKENVQLYENADCYALGTQNLQVYNALYAGLLYLKEIGWCNIYKRLIQLTNYLVEQIKDVANIVSPVDYIEERSAIIVIDLENNNDRCLEYLKKRNIIIGKRNEKLRISVNIFNNFDDIDMLVATIKEGLSIHFESFPTSSV